MQLLQAKVYNQVHCMQLHTHTCTQCPRTTVQYLRLASPQYIHHNLHDSLVHAQYSHQIRVLVEHLIVHYVTKTYKIKEKTLG